MTWISALAVPLAITGVFLLFRFYFPRKGGAEGASFDPAERKRFHRLHLQNTLVFPLLVVILLYILSSILPRIRLGVDPGPDLLFAGLPGSLEWLIAALFPALGLGVLILDRLEAFFLKDALDRFREFQSSAYGFNAAKVRSFLITSTLVAGLLITVLMLDWRFVLRKDRVVVDGFFSMTEEQYAVREVSSVITAPSIQAPNGKIVASREYAVRMADGRGFNSIGLPGVNPRNRDSLFTLIALLSGKGLTEKAVLEREDLN